MAAQRTLEINPRHPLVVALNARVKTSPDDESTKDLAYHLFDTALLNSGFTQDDLEGFSDRMYRTMAGVLGVGSMDLVEEVEVEKEEEEEEKEEESKGEHDGAEL